MNDVMFELARTTWQNKMTMVHRARFYLRHFKRTDFEHHHTGLLRFSQPIELCACGAFRNGRGKQHISDSRWIEPGATQRTLAEARKGNRLAQRAIHEEFQYAR
jgi:hypothetical protein